MMEVITTHDKDVRDRLFEDLRKNGNELERKVVKFSGNELIRNAPHRPVYRSTWSVAYPNS